VAAPHYTILIPPQNTNSENGAEIWLWIVHFKGSDFYKKLKIILQMPIKNTHLLISYF